MTFLHNENLDHLRSLIDLPDLTGTRYRIERRLAVGGMGSVYLATDTELNRPVALKVLTVSDSHGVMIARMRREAQIMAGLEHPSIVPVHDVGTLSDGRVYYAMKYVSGQTLGSLTGKRPPLTTLLILFQKVCQAVAFAHSRGVVHRDIKPENIMLGEYGEALVMDWGIAKSISPETESIADAFVPDSPSFPETTSSTTASGGAPTGPGIIAGTPAFMSPEQAEGYSDEVDSRADIYSLGATLYFILTGRPPYENVDSAARAKAGEPARPRQIDRTIPMPLEAICLLAMAHNPNHRYQTADELAAEIGRFLNREPVRAYKENIFQRLGRTIARHQFIIIIVLFYVIARLIIFFSLGN